jgi:hypothetical protein
LRERLRRRLASEDEQLVDPRHRPPPVELIDSLEAGREQELVCLRRVDVPIHPAQVPLLVEQFQKLRPASASVPPIRAFVPPLVLHVDLGKVALASFGSLKRYVRIAVAFHAEELPLELLQLHIGHAALAIERALREARAA